jgi:cytoplasmic iron level regulating protein YaaA (DUF328/UPF0246 family)
MVILLHSSKTMRSPMSSQQPSQPQLLNKTQLLGDYLKILSPKQIARVMHISPALASKTHALVQNWNTESSQQSLAIDSFVGDIYSGLQASSLSITDRDYANKNLYILSGLYGLLRPFDGVQPYRLEMAYKLPNKKFSSLYKFWGTSIVDCLPQNELIINTSSDEYTKAILSYVDPNLVIAPQFLTINPKTKQPTQVIVHTKIARGAFARWLITSRITDPNRFDQFTDLNYQYSSDLSSPNTPVYICQTFGGTGLSLRLL